jgi:hypothetical protein
VEFTQFIGDHFVDCEGSGNSSAAWALSVLITAASLVIIAGDAPLFGTCPVNGSAGLIIGYHQTTTEGSEQLPSIDEAFLHVCYLNVSDSGLGMVPFCVEGVAEGACLDATPDHAPWA